MPVASEESRSRRAQLVGLGMSVAGLTHFLAPQLFEPMVAAVFADDARKHVFINGCIETALGAGVAVGRTRPLAIVATIGYVGYLAGNFLRNR
ncbi:MAG: hypothetical protein ABI065_09030 [Terrimesophilobacter sp.]